MSLGAAPRRRRPGIVRILTTESVLLGLSKEQNRRPRPRIRQRRRRDRRVTFEIFETASAKPKAPGDSEPNLRPRQGRRPCEGEKYSTLSGGRSGGGSAREAAASPNGKSARPGAA